MIWIISWFDPTRVKNNGKGDLLGPLLYFAPRALSTNTLIVISAHGE